MGPITLSNTCLRLTTYNLAITHSSQAFNLVCNIKELFLEENTLDGTLELGKAQSLRGLDVQA